MVSGLLFRFRFAGLGSSQALFKPKPTTQRGVIPQTEIWLQIRNVIKDANSLSPALVGSKGPKIEFRRGQL